MVAHCPVILLFPGLFYPVVVFLAFLYKNRTFLYFYAANFAMNIKMQTSSGQFDGRWRATSISDFFKNSYGTYY